MDVFRLRSRLVADFGDYVRSFIHIADERLRGVVDSAIDEGLLWPDPLIQLNPSFEAGGWIDELCEEGVLLDECRRIFRKDKDDPETQGRGRPLRLHRHQADAVRTAKSGANYVLTTGTGSGKSLAYIIPIVDHVLRRGPGSTIQAIVVYPMNALANSQLGELEKFLCLGYPAGKQRVSFAPYTGQENEERKREIIANPPQILLTNYVMLELILTRPAEVPLVAAARGLRFLVLDELHTYRGRQGADVSLLVRRAREAFEAPDLQCVGTSATLASEGSLEEQREAIANVASRIFGAPVDPAHVIGETLARTTPEPDLSDSSYVEALREQVADESWSPATAYAEFVSEPLSSWIEGAFGIARDEESERLTRAAPRTIHGTGGAAEELANLIGLPAERCAEAIEKQLLASYGSESHPDTGFPAFAFRLHQFIGRGDTAYASPESEDSRYLTVERQRFVPGDRDRVLLPLVFCRECGQEYYCVRDRTDPLTGQSLFEPRELSDREKDDESEAGFLYLSTKAPWLEIAEELSQRLPDDWMEETPSGTRIRRNRRDRLPRPVRVNPDGTQCETGLECHYFPAPFLFCLRCGVSYSARQRSDYGKLASLGTEGRSTATTILSLAAIRYLRGDASLSQRARKLLSFTDNRQDASLQSGHFNDFVEVSLLRSALYRAVAESGATGLRHDELVQRVFEALDLPKGLYASDPEVKFQALADTNRALRSVLGYRLYRDLERGWRITSPNLEQCGLLEIDYLSLEELCRSEEEWEGKHEALRTASPETRVAVAKTLLDLMRRELAIKVEYLDPEVQERIQLQSSQRLRDPWTIDENEKNERMESAKVLYPRSRSGREARDRYFLSPRGGFGQYLGRCFPDLEARLTVGDRGQIARDLLEALRVAGIVEAVSKPSSDEETAGYQLLASALLWKAGDGTRAYHDPIRVPRAPASGGRTNPFFVDFYRGIAEDGKGLEAREHTAQVPAPVRKEREDAFREGRLPILYCSPTMELGVDIAELNAVNLRNMPPTPANYAQRSGRAGRSGQPALVFSYCSNYSPHDQYFFRRPKRMVSGAVSPPRIDLANEDLLRAHIHAVWLAETRVPLGSSLRDILDLAGEDPTLELLPSVKEGIRKPGALERARRRSRRVLEGIEGDLAEAAWYDAEWLDRTLNAVTKRFDQACERWRDLFRAASRQQAAQNRVIKDHSRSAEDKKRARRLRFEAESQLELLTETDSIFQADFYSYRYFASEGFLPGYNFPRLPLSAYIPGRRGRQGRDEFVSRPRFLAISEFGPRAIVYHEGARYLINQVILGGERVGDSDEIATSQAKLCGQCGYLHDQQGEGAGADVCERCRRSLPAPIASLFRLQNVSTRRRDRISSDEEERLRLGYELKTGVRFERRGGQLSARIAAASTAEGSLAHLTYGDAARLWRINLGWRRRARREEHGFVLDLERGYWARNQEELDESEDPMSKRVRRVVPFVEDHRNCLLFELVEKPDVEVMASLQAALKHAIQVEFQLEDMELAAEPLPGPDDRRQILLFESAEGGAGVLRRLVDDSRALSRVARSALEICHFDPETGGDRGQAPNARERCEAACYDCLMSYSNQPDHQKLDRWKIRDLLLALRDADVAAAPAALPRADHLAGLMRLCESGLERDWLQHLEDRALNLPTHAQRRIEECNTRPDFLYGPQHTAIYVDGPHHQYRDRQERDREQVELLEDSGYTVLRFGAEGEWSSTLNRYPGIFGVLGETASLTTDREGPERGGYEADLFPADWRRLLGNIAKIPGVQVEPGGDVTAAGRVIGNYVAAIDAKTTGVSLRVVDSRSEGATTATAALEGEGYAVISIDPTDAAAEGAFRQALELGP